MGYDVLAFPRSRNGDFLSIRTNMVVFGGHVRWIVFELVAPCVSDIHINGIAIAMKLPYARNRNIVPSFIVETDFPKISWAGIGILYPIELPSTVQSHEVSRVFFNAFLGRIVRFVSKVIGVHRSTVDGIYSRVFPFLEGLCSHG